jgi:6-pyruvoyltetrahydropterin/6-carboxytetrahydropterin synthase
MVFPGDPTTEALAAVFFLKLSAFLEADQLPYRVEEIRVEETPTNAVRLNRVLFDPARCGVAADHWARRPDMSINDFSRVMA